MADKPEEKFSFGKDVPKIALGAAIPLLLSLGISFLGNFFFPKNEVRFVPSQIDPNTIYLVIENHRRDLLGPISFSTFRTPGLKIISHSDFVDIDLKASGVDYFIMTLSKILPSQRTTLILHSEQALSGGNFELIDGGSNTSVVPGVGLESSNIPTGTWVGLGMQGVMYMVIFYFFNLFINQSRIKADELNDKLEESRAEMLRAEEKRSAFAESLQSQIKSIRNAAAKDKILTRKLYDQIDRENRMWRGVVLKIIGGVIARNRAISIDILRSIVKSTGINRKEGLQDLSIEMLLQSIGEDEDSNIDLARQIKRVDRL